MGDTIKLTLTDDQIMVWFVHLAGLHTGVYERRVPKEMAERWLRISGEWNRMQLEISEFYYGVKK